MKTHTCVRLANAFALVLALVLSIELKSAPPSTTTNAPEFCGTMQAWLQTPQGKALALQSSLTGTCITSGDCDSPSSRDAAIPSANTPYKYVRLRFHVFANTDGSNLAGTPAEIQNEVDRLNADYASSRFRFFYSMRTISNTTYRYVGTNAGGTNLEFNMKAAYAENPGSQLNIFVTGYTNFNNCGIATFPFDNTALTSQGGMRLQDFSVAPSRFGQAASFSECISHEMGHMLGLLHTFRGTLEVTNCQGCREFAGRNTADGDASGDFCSDTAPDPGLTSLAAPCSAGSVTDKCNNVVYTGVDTNNFMSYYQGCYSRFTQQQKGRMHCWSASVLSGWFITDSTPPAIALTTLTDGQQLTALPAISGWVTDDMGFIQSVGVTIHEIDPGGGAGRWWNGTNWQVANYVLPTTITGTNWTLQAGLALPALNSGASYAVAASAVDGQFNGTSASATVQVPVQEISWDPGTTHAGTVAKNSPNSNGGPFVYKIVTQSTAVGGWRTALNVLSGSAKIYLSFNAIPTESSYYYASENAGSNGFVLNSSQFGESQEWYYLIVASAGSSWRLVSGEPYVTDLGQLPATTANANTNVIVGAEGWRFFRTVAPAQTLAWRLWLNGATNTLHVKKDFIPLDAGRNDLNQAGAMLVVPDYLQDNQTYFVGVPGTPGQTLAFQSKQQPVTDIAFNAGQSGVALSGYPYATYRVPVPIDQIAWQVRTIPTAGNSDLAIRRSKVPNEFNNDAYSEVPGTVQDSVTLVPPTLSDGTYFVTVYGATNRTFTVTNGEPVIPTRAYALTNVNDQPLVAGWRYYVVSDIASQLGTLGWELMLSNQVGGTEIALRRNAVPGRWNYRTEGNQGSQGYVQYSETDGWMQRPGHQADIWYIGIYQPATNLGTFTLATRAIVPAAIGFNAASTNVTSLPSLKWRYIRVDVPSDALGWDLRLTNFTGTPRLTVARDVLPGGLGAGMDIYSHVWPSGGEVSAGADWTGEPLNPNGSSSDGKILAFGRDNPLQPGTYYVGVRDDTGPGPVSFTLASRGIGTNYAIAVSNLNFSGVGTNATLTLAAREAAYFRFVVPSNQPNWKLRLSPQGAGDALMIVQRDFLPNILDGGGNHVGYGRKLQKSGREHFLMLPDGDYLLPGETNYIAVVSEGLYPDPLNGYVGSNTTTFTLESLGPQPVTSLGALTATPGSSVAQHVTLEGGEVKLLKFTVATNTPFIELRMTNRVGNPSFTVRFGTNAGYPHVPSFDYEHYGAEGGLIGGLLEDYSQSSYVTIANPAAGTYTVTVKAEDYGSAYPDASADLSVTVRGPTPINFQSATSIAGQPSREWRFFSVTVPTNALGWDLRLDNVSGGRPEMYVRRDLLPDGASSFIPMQGHDWPSGGQVGAPASDWTERYQDANAFDRSYQRLVVGRGNPLTNGTYIVAVYNDVTPGTDVSYTLTSRGIGTNLTIGVSNLSFSGTGSAVTNTVGLAGREGAYYQVVIPPNKRSWKLRLTPTDGGELMMIVHSAEVPNSGNISRYPFNSVGKKLQKDGKEHYLLLPDEGQAFLAPGTNYVVVVAEGHNPGDPYTLGTGSVTYVLESLGEAPMTELGRVPVVGAGAITQHVVIEGGESKLFRFEISNAIPSVDLRLDNIVAGDPTLAVIAGTNPPYAGDNAHSIADDFYGGDGGWYSARSETHSLLTLINPAQGIYSISIKADDLGGYPDVDCDLTLTAVGANNVAFDGGTSSVAGQEPNSWRFFTVQVPADALGWDLRLSDVTGSNVRIYVRRDQLPDLAAPALPNYENGWPSGEQLAAVSDWTQGLLDADGSNPYGHVLVLGRDNPLTNGTYYIGVLHDNDSQNASYTLTSRGIGAGYSIPVGTIAFNGTASNPSLAPREVAYYAVEIPSNAPSWKLRLDTSAGGESRLVVHKAHLPNSASDFSSPGVRGHVLAKGGNENYVLLPDEGRTNLDGGTYYVGVVSEGTDGIPGNLGASPSAFTLQSLGVMPVTDLPLVPAAGGILSQPFAVEAGETKAFHYQVPIGVQWLELRMANRQGNPGFAVRRGVELPYPNVPSYYNNYGADGGWTSGRSEGYLFQTFVRPEAGPWALTVKAEFSGSEYADASGTVQLEQLTPSVLAFTNGVVSTSLGDNQRIFYQVTVPANVLGWKLDLVASNGAPTLRVRKDLLPSDSEPGMPFGGPSVIIAPPFLAPGTWFVEVKGGGATTFRLTSNPVLLQRPTWNMPALGAAVTTTGLVGTAFFADTGVTTNGTALPGDQGTDLGAGDFHYYAVNVPPGNGGLVRAELRAISGNPDLFVRRSALPTLSHPEFGALGRTLVDYQLVGVGTEYANWVPFDGRTDAELAPGAWFFAVRANEANARYRLKLSVGTVTNLAAGTVLSGQQIAGGDWRYYRIVLPTNAPQSLSVTYSQQQGDTELYVRDTIPPGEPADSAGYLRWSRDSKNGGPYLDFPDAGTYTLSSPPLRPGHAYYLGFRAVNDASFTVSFTTNAQTIGVTNVVAFYGGSSTVTIPAFGVAKFRVPVPADATSWRHSNTHAAAVLVYLDQGAPPDLSIPYSLWSSAGNPNSQLIQYLYGWPWVTNQNYYFVATNTSASAQSLTIRMDGRNLATDDSDGDGLPDGWEMLHFGNLSQNGSGDFDGDGINNATEFADNTDPANATSLRPRLSVQVTGSGHVVIEPNLASYTAGQQVTLTAVADSGNVFTAWSGATTNVTSNPLTLTMNSNMTVIATFNTAAAPLAIGSIVLLPDGHVQFNVTGPSASDLFIDGAGGLGEPWTLLRTITPFNGTYLFEDTDPTATNRFYRARLP